MILTRQQREAVLKVYQRQRDNPTRETYRQFRRRACPGFGCVMIPWAGMWLGIEPDGYTHS